MFVFESVLEISGEAKRIIFAFKPLLCLFSVKAEKANEKAELFFTRTMAVSGLGMAGRLYSGPSREAVINELIRDFNDAISSLGGLGGDEDRLLTIDDFVEYR